MNIFIPAQLSRTSLISALHFRAQESRPIERFFSVQVFPADEITADEKENGHRKAAERRYSNLPRPIIFLLGSEVQITLRTHRDADSTPDTAVLTNR